MANGNTQQATSSRKKQQAANVATKTTLVVDEAKVAGSAVKSNNQHFKIDEDANNSCYQSFKVSHFAWWDMANCCLLILHHPCHWLIYLLLPITIKSTVPCTTIFTTASALADCCFFFCHPSFSRLLLIHFP